MWKVDYGGGHCPISQARSFLGVEPEFGSTGSRLQKIPKYTLTDLLTKFVNSKGPSHTPKETIPTPPPKRRRTEGQEKSSGALDSPKSGESMAASAVNAASVDSLMEMGFAPRERVENALRAAKGNIEQALLALTAEPAASGDGAAAAAGGHHLALRRPDRRGAAVPAPSAHPAPGPQACQLLPGPQGER